MPPWTDSPGLCHDGTVFLVLRGAGKAEVCVRNEGIAGWGGEKAQGVLGGDLALFEGSPGGQGQHMCLAGPKADIPGQPREEVRPCERL